MMIYGRRLCACSLLLLGALLVTASWSMAAPGLANRGARSGARSHRFRAESRRSDRVRGGAATSSRNGSSASPRAVTSIVGGTATSISNFPFQVALYNPHDGPPAVGFFCGGVIIDATHVITAAHCIATGAHGQVGPLDEIEVLAGSTSLTAIDPGSVRDPVEAASYDPEYNPATSNFDVGLLTLVRPLWNGPTPSIDGIDKIAPLPVNIEQAATSSSSQTEQPILATVSGWGDVNPAPTDGPSYPTGLRSARVPLVSETLCAEEYAGIEQTITPSMICAGNSRPRTDSCYGDSGGPLVVDRDTPADPPADYVLVGLVDFGNGCAQPGYPGVYTRIANPEVAGFLASGVGRTTKLVAKQSRKKRRRRRRRHR